MKNQGKKGLFVACIGGGALALALAAAPAVADSGADPAGMSAGSKSRTMHETATVTAIDKSARIVTVKNESGEKHNFQVSSDVKAFDKLKTGDKIDVDYTESIAVSMLPPGTKPSASKRAGAMRTGEEAGVAGRQTTISAEVLEVDVANNKVTFKGPKGNARVVTVQDPDMQAKLPSLKPGQVIQFTYSEAMAVSIQPHK